MCYLSLLGGGDGATKDLCSYRSRDKGWVLVEAAPLPEKNQTGRVGVSALDREEAEGEGEAGGGEEGRADNEDPTSLRAEKEESHHMGECCAVCCVCTGTGTGSLHCSTV